MPTLPDYYSELAPFVDQFAQGLPSLCYHKIEKAPRGARIKGLYLSADLFARQISELKNAGFHFVPPGLPARTVSNRQISITFDDGFVSNWKSAMPLMKEQGCKAMNFLVADRLGKSSDWESLEGGEARPLMDDVQVREWLAEGNWIGAHTCTHPRLSQIPLTQAKEEILGSKKKLEDRFGISIEHFAYPYGDYNSAVREAVCEAGFKTASTMHRGVNTGETSAWELKRWTARYPTSNLKTLLRRIFPSLDIFQKG
ncbi:polysaccharide deacetylase family protein [bacterium]|nr:polysaccharide deacetylase family protein [bacterium]